MPVVTTAAYAALAAGASAAAAFAAVWVAVITHRAAGARVLVLVRWAPDGTNDLVIEVSNAVRSPAWIIRVGVDSGGLHEVWTFQGPTQDGTADRYQAHGLDATSRHVSPSEVTRVLGDGASATCKASYSSGTASSSVAVDQGCGTSTPSQRASVMPLVAATLALHAVGTEVPKAGGWFIGP